jgi:predicted nucleic acid-binding protein
MENFVIDVNILFSGILSRKKFYEELFLRDKFYVPDFALVELQKYKKVIRKKLAEHQADFDKFAVLLFSNLNVIPEFLLSDNIIEEAENLCKDVDIKDSLYVALAIFLNTTLITRDKPIYNHLKNNGFDSVMLFDDFVSQYLIPKNGGSILIMG